MIVDTQRETWFVDGRWHDEHIYSILRCEYNARHHPEWPQPN